MAEVLEQIAALTTEVNDQRLARLTAEHKNVRKLGRKAEQELQLATEAFKTADVYALNVMTAQEQARMTLEHLHDQEQRGEHLGRFHSDAELEKWNAKVEEAKELWRTVAEMAQEAVNDRAQRQKDLKEQRNKVAKLAAAESRIRAELKGLPTWDAELGLGQPAQRSLTSDIVPMMGRD